MNDTEETKVAGPSGPENINWPSGPIFVQFDWPDRKYTGHGPAVTSTPAKAIVFKQLRSSFSLSNCFFNANCNMGNLSGGLP